MEELKPTIYLLYCNLCGLPFTVFIGETNEEAFESHLKEGCDVASILLKKKKYAEEIGNHDICEHLNQVFLNMYNKGFQVNPCDFYVVDPLERLKEFGHNF